LEMQLPDLGMFTIQDPETGEQLFIDTHDKAFRRRFAQAADQREGELRDSFRRAGVDVLELSTDDDIADSILRFSQIRRRRSRVTAAADARVHLDAVL
jgi:uncharacterized protein (DUF58 family)